MSDLHRELTEEAIRKDNVESLTILKQHGIKINMDINAEPAVFYAIRLRKRNALNYYLYNCNDEEVLYCRSAYNDTVLHDVMGWKAGWDEAMWCISNSEEILFPSLTKLTGYRGESLLHRAIHQSAPRDLSLVHELLSRGVSPHVANERGETPLHTAVRASRTSIVRRLMSHASDEGTEGDLFWARNKDCATALDIATWQTKTRVIAVLVESAIERLTERDLPGFIEKQQ